MAVVSLLNCDELSGLCQTQWFTLFSFAHPDGFGSDFDQL